MASFDDDIPAEDQPLPGDALPIACSPGHIADSEPIKDDLKEDREIDPIDYATDEEDESFEDEEEEEHLALADSALSVLNSVPSAEETKPFETDEARISIQPHTPPSPSTEARIAEFKIEESSTAATARQTRPALAHRIDYGFIDTLDATIRATDESVMTTLEGATRG
nr:hypothetical protein [Tanacetum cinerariifolium]